MRVAVLVRAKMKPDNLVDAQKLHDSLIGNGRESFQLAGNYSHHALINPEDEREFLSIDLWDKPTIEDVKQFYMDTAFQEAASAFVDGQPQLTFLVDPGWLTF